MSALDDARERLTAWCDGVAPHVQFLGEESWGGHVEDLRILLEATAPPTDDEREASRGTAEDPTDSLARVIWETSRADEGTISATGANIVARALLAAGFRRRGPITDEMVEAALRKYETPTGAFWRSGAREDMRAALEAADAKR